MSRRGVYNIGGSAGDPDPGSGIQCGRLRQPALARLVPRPCIEVCFISCGSVQRIIGSMVVVHITWYPAIFFKAGIGE